MIFVVFVRSIPRPPRARASSKSSSCVGHRRASRGSGTPHWAGPSLPFTHSHFTSIPHSALDDAACATPVILRPARPTSRRQRHRSRNGVRAVLSTVIPWTRYRNRRLNHLSVPSILPDPELPNPSDVRGAASRTVLRDTESAHATPLRVARYRRSWGPQTRVQYSPSRQRRRARTLRAVGTPRRRHLRVSQSPKARCSLTPSCGL